MRAIEMAGDRSIFDQPHHQSLELLATQALADGKIATAFKLADRRCRIPPEPEPHCYVLRAEALFQMGAKAAAVANIATALEIAPDNLVANRRMLTWAEGPQQLRAALTLIGHERNFDSLRKAITVLQESGKENFASVTVLDDTIEGWAVWQDAGSLELSITDGTHNVTAMFESDPFHPLADYGNATNFRFPRPQSTNAQSILLSVAGSVLHSSRTGGNVGEPAMRVHWPRPKNVRDRRVTVIVPVYGDCDATRDCLESLLDELRATCHHAIVVDDASPDPRIASYLAKLASEPCIELLTNHRNLGFAGSVNRALANVKQDDVILLNADTVVPFGFIKRLTAAAHSSSDIGTVTPLSNNGEFTSFPIPNTANLLGSREDIERVDRIAAKLNADRVIDIPSGIGFCLYVTRACLDQVGPLSNDFGAGYLEDADFCLRARERGFRNVCAPAVYVGHAGSKSFKQDKRALVVHNLGMLERRFPKHREECAAFIVADPLQTARQTIECAAAATPSHPRLLITGTGVIGAVTRERARAIASETEPVVILQIRHCTDGAMVTITNAEGGMPQSLQFNLASSNGHGALVDFLQSQRPSGIEILDPANVPQQLVELLLTLKVPYDIFIADAGLLGPRDAQPIAIAALESPAGNGQRVPSAKTGAEVGKEEETNWVKRWRTIADGARRILVPCPQAEAFAASILPQHAIEAIARPAEKRGRNPRKVKKLDSRHLAFVPVRSCAHEQRLMSAVIRNFIALQPDLSFTIIGTTLDDMGLMRGGNAFVTGAVAAEDFEHLIAALGVRHLFVSTTRPLFGHPTLNAAHSSSLPTAYFDWSTGRIKPKRQDLAIDPRSSLDDIIDAVSRWMLKP